MSDQKQIRPRPDTMLRANSNVPASSEVAARRIDYGGDDYRRSLQLRDAVLRRPLGRSIADDDLSGDVEALHVGAFAEECLVGILLLKPKSEGLLQMKQVAVDESLRGMNVGRKLVKYAEELAARQGCREIMLHAREVAVIFYEKLGYTREGELFEEMGIPHYVMRKKLK
ncbi:GNAT family N-acetyltransferase [Saccharibacillus sacchari]|uniref:GNAT family N-acetyltransferase n=1 Tax=Saccharibacillus sacchari TaxID=456493 RepID=UPI0004B70BB7|nr:GNAT family N-acetyltransferase [Saccharibacillus sacchari]